MRALSAIALFLLLCLPPQAERTYRNDVQELLESCKASTASNDFTWCIAKVESVADMIGYNGTIISVVPNGLFNWEGMCASGDLTHGAMIQVFINWAEQHPEK
jgi:hypothetical protein